MCISFALRERRPSLPLMTSSSEVHVRWAGQRLEAVSPIVGRGLQHQLAQPQAQPAHCSRARVWTGCIDECMALRTR